MDMSKIDFNSMFHPEELDTVGDQWLIKLRGSQKIRHDMYMALLDNVFHNINNSDFDYLDIGCAQGQILRRIHQNHNEVVLHGTDISSNIISWNERNIPFVNFAQHALPNIWPEKKLFNVITMFELLFYIKKDDQIQALHNLEATLKPKGYMMVSGGLDGGKRYFDEQWIVNEVAKIMDVQSVSYSYAKGYRIIETPLVQVIRWQDVLDKFWQSSNENQQNILSRQKTMVRLFLKSYKSSSPLGYLTRGSYRLFIKLARTVVSWKWLPRVADKLTRMIYKDKGKTNIVIVAKKRVVT